MFKDKRARNYAAVIAAGLLAALYMFTVFSVIEILIIIAVGIMLAGSVFSDWHVSRNMPDLDNPKNLKSYAIVIKDFEQRGDHFEGLIKLNGVQWKAKSISSPFKSGSVVITTSLDGLIYEVEEKI